jgi:hypothetical protein
MHWLNHCLQDRNKSLLVPNENIIHRFSNKIVMMHDTLPQRIRKNRQTLYVAPLITIKMKKLLTIMIWKLKTIIICGNRTQFTHANTKVTNRWLTLRYVLLAMVRQKSEPWNYKFYNIQISFITCYGVNTQFTYFQTMDSMSQKTIWMSHF